MKKLPKFFYQQNTRKVAQALLGHFLCRKINGQIYRGIITETEAYCGPQDRASHASRGITKRTEVMFGPAGRVYVYLIYGMYYCFNIVTEREGYPSAVLIRSCQPIKTYKKIIPVGPGKLCQAFRIDKKLSGVSLASNKIWVAKSRLKIKPKDISKAKRVGVDYAGVYRNKEWRYFYNESNLVSRSK